MCTFRPDSSPLLYVNQLVQDGHDYDGVHLPDVSVDEDGELLRVVLADGTLGTTQGVVG